MGIAGFIYIFYLAHVFTMFYILGTTRFCKKKCHQHFYLYIIRRTEVVDSVEITANTACCNVTKPGPEHAL